MITKRLFAGISTLAVGLALAACADAPRSPLAPEAGPSQLTLSALASPTTATKVEGLKWKRPLASNVVRTATIGILGGQINIPELGFRMTVPAGAVLTPTQFKVTALAGKAVAYEFEPSGSKFTVPLLVAQDRTVTDATPALGLAASLGYFRSEADLDQALGVATVTELNPALSISTPTTMLFPVYHFSGYIVCWGRGQESEAQ